MSNSNGFQSRPGGGDARGGGRASGGTRPSPSPHGGIVTSRTGFQYKERDPEALKQRAERSGQRWDSIYKPGFTIWKPKQGDNCVRFLPPTWEGADHYGLKIWCHNYVGVDSGSYMCNQHMNNKPCPVCMAAVASAKAGDEEDAKKNRVSERCLTWILARDSEEPFKPQLFQMSWTMDREIAALCKATRGQEAIWLDKPDDGYDFNFQRTGLTMKNTRYLGYQIDRQPSPIAADARTQEGIERFIERNPLPEVLRSYAPDYISRALVGTTYAGAASTDEDEGAANLLDEMDPLEEDARVTLFDEPPRQRLRRE